jgi:hypothetical protein
MKVILDLVRMQCFHLLIITGVLIVHLGQNAMGVYLVVLQMARYGYRAECLCALVCAQLAIF